MEIVSTSTSKQVIKIIPRELVTDLYVYVVDKQNDSKFINQNEIGLINNEFLTVPFTATFFKEGGYYFIKVDNVSGDRIWQGELFCTDKTDLQNYKIDE